MLTVHGIETVMPLNICGPFYIIVATVLTVYGIETLEESQHYMIHQVATALTVYGIETDVDMLA